MIAAVQQQARELGALYAGSLPRGFFTEGYSGGRWLRVMRYSEPTLGDWTAWGTCYGASFWPDRTRA